MAANNIFIRIQDPEKLAARAARFGIVQPVASQTPPPSAKTGAQTNGKKRSAPPVEAIDAEEQERRRKRAERFGMPVVVRLSLFVHSDFHAKN